MYIYAGIEKYAINLYYQFNPLTAGAAYIVFFYIFLAHYISAFKPVKDKK